ncbi:hypothetical protein AMK09_29530 [Streptomyces sp. CB02488]|nr:hypothetical protein AMK09_29530 [Streptomyces sp. CB02488]
MTSRTGPRPYRPDDRAALADICVRTADNGGDSSHLYPDPELMPSIFAAPYAYLFSRVCDRVVHCRVAPKRGAVCDGSRRRVVHVVVVVEGS